MLTRTFHCCRSEAAHATGTARGPSEGGAAGLGVALLAAHVAAGQAGAQDAERRLPVWGRRLWSTETVLRMELLLAAREKDWERVKVRRPLEAVSGTEYGPSRGVCLGLGQWTLEAFRRTPDSAWLCRIQPLRQAPLRQF